MEHLIDYKLKEIAETYITTLSSVNGWISQMKKYLSEESSQNPKVISRLKTIFEIITSAIYENNKLLLNKVEVVDLEDRIACIVSNIEEMREVKIDYEYGMSKNNYKVNKIGCDVIYEVIKNAVKYKANSTITAQKSDLNNVKIIISVDTGDFDSISELERLKLRDIDGTIENIKKEKGNTFEITLPILEAKDVQITQQSQMETVQHIINIQGGARDNVIILGNHNKVE